MKVSFRYVLTTALLFAMSLAPITAQAIDVVSDTEVSIPADKTIDDDLAAGGTTIDVAGQIKGNLYAGGSTIIVTGPVTGGLHAAGSEVTLNGPVGDDLWAAGGTLTVHSTVEHNLGLAGGTITLAPEATVGRDAMVAGNHVMIDCAIGHNLNIGATTAVVSGHISGKVDAYVDKLTLTETAIVDHDLTVYSPNPPEIAPGAQVKGAIHYHPTERARQVSLFEQFRGWVAGWLTSCASAIVLGFVLLYFFPNQIVRVTEVLRRQTGKSLLVGAVSLIAAPIATIMITASVIGIPIAVCIGGIYIMALLAAVVPCTYIAGTVISRMYPNINRWASMALGALAITFVTSLPYIGGVAGLLLLMAGSGALLLFFRDLLMESKKG